MRRLRIPPVLAVATGALLLASTACDDDTTGPDDVVGSIELSIENEEVEIGSTAQLEFEVRDASGAVLDPDDVDIQFTSSAASVATVSETGLITPVGPGTATITASVGTVSDTVTITVINEISSIEIAGTTLDLVTDETSTLDVTVLNAEGDPVEDPALTFTTSNASIVSVTQEGVLTAEEAGTATITVSGGGETDTIEVTVLAGSSGGLSVLLGNAFSILADDDFTVADLVEVRDAGGTIIPDADLAFQTRTAGIVTIDAAGLLMPVAPGTTLVTVTSPDAPVGSEATFRVNVLESGVVDVFEFAAGTPTTIGVGATSDFGLTVESDGTPITNLFTTFTSSDETVATVDPFTGEVTGVAAGTATITATTGTLTTEIDVTVE